MANNNSTKGKRDNQKMKPFFVMQYLLKNSDENNRLTAADIRDALIEKYNISSNVRSIYDDINEINKAYYLLNSADETETMENAAAALEADEYYEEKLIVYSHSSPRGFYVKNRKLELDEVRLLAECIYTSKFIIQREADKLIDVINDLTSLDNSRAIKHDVVVSDRVKTTNKSVINSLSVINTAMALKIEAKPHTPEKISFQMITHTMADKEKPVARKTLYKVSPYKLIVNDGNYYLLAFEDKSQKMKTYRIDRMK
ncbi:MAG: WYL domain-containing protein, partial [Oscillospiraceae bacterium]|nr:WYL domain-containing protein [Oscillospiraceae bacterium]